MTQANWGYRSEEAFLLDQQVSPRFRRIAFAQCDICSHWMTNWQDWCGFCAMKDFDKDFHVITNYDKA